MTWAESLTSHWALAGWGLLAGCLVGWLAARLGRLR